LGLTRRSIGRKSTGSADQPRPHQNNTPALSSGSLRRSVIIHVSSAPASAHDNLGSGVRKNGASQPANRHVPLPSISTHATRAAVGAASASGILLVGGHRAVISSTAGVARSSPSHIPTRIAVSSAVIGDD